MPSLPILLPDRLSDVTVLLRCKIIASIVYSCDRRSGTTYQKGHGECDASTCSETVVLQIHLGCHQRSLHHGRRTYVQFLTFLFVQLHVGLLARRSYNAMRIISFRSSEDVNQPLLGSPDPFSSKSSSSESDELHEKALFFFFALRALCASSRSASPVLGRMSEILMCCICFKPGKDTFAKRVYEFSTIVNFLAARIASIAGSFRSPRPTGPIIAARATFASPRFEPLGVSPAFDGRLASSTSPSSPTISLKS